MNIEVIFMIIFENRVTVNEYMINIQHKTNSPISLQQEKLST